MRRTDPNTETGLIACQDLMQQTAFHEAGHAAGIYLYSKKMGLPPVFFQIRLKKTDFLLNSSPQRGLSAADFFVAEIEGGRLIPELPVGLLESASYFSIAETDAYRSAIETDIINLLIGALAEAKHAALRGQGYFEPSSVSIHSLPRYGGLSDLKEVYELLESTIACGQKREETLLRLFKKALDFVANPVHWHAIERLAGYILAYKDSPIHCEKTIAVLDEAVA